MKYFKIDSIKKGRLFEQFLTKNLETLPGKKFVVYYYMDGCGACGVFKPTWDSITKNAKKNNKMVVVEVEQKYIDKFAEEAQVSAFPTVRIITFKKNGNLKINKEHVGVQSHGTMEKIVPQKG